MSIYLSIHTIMKLGHPNLGSHGQFYNYQFISPIHFCVRNFYCCIRTLEKNRIPHPILFVRFFSFNIISIGFRLSKGLIFLLVKLPIFF